MIKEEDIGKRIKELRLSQELTLEQVGQRADFTKGYLSRIENSRKAPSVSALFRIASALNVRMSDIFDEPEDSSLITIVRKNERPIMARPGSDFGYYYETLAHNFKNKIMDVYILTRPPDSGGKPIVFKHEGQEILFILDGAMEFTYGGDKYILEKGDCAYFNSAIEHYGHALGNKTVKSLMVACQPNS